jgi:hypothetical protein
LTSAAKLDAPQIHGDWTRARISNTPSTRTPTIRTIMPTPLTRRLPAATTHALRRARKRLYRRLLAVALQPDAMFACGWAGAVAASEAAFRQQELLMDLVNDPRLRQQRADNAHLLSALHHVTPCVESGDCTIGRQALRALALIVSAQRYRVRGPHVREPRHLRAARRTVAAPMRADTAIAAYL